MNESQGLCRMFCICTMFLLELHWQSYVIQYLELGHWMVLFVFEFYSIQQFYFEWLEKKKILKCCELQTGQTSGLSLILCSINYYSIPVKGFVLRLSFASSENLIMQTGLLSSVSKLSPLPPSFVHHLHKYNILPPSIIKGPGLTFILFKNALIFLMINGADKTCLQLWVLVRWLDS